MIHFYLLQSDKMKQSALSKIISSEENKFYLPDQLQFIPLSSHGLGPSLLHTQLNILDNLVRKTQNIC